MSLLILCERVVSIAEREADLSARLKDAEARAQDLLAEIRWLTGELGAAASEKRAVLRLGAAYFEPNESPPQ